MSCDNIELLPNPMFLKNSNSGSGGMAQVVDLLPGSNPSTAKKKKRKGNS
jgi:hypothetical protein